MVVAKSNFDVVCEHSPHPAKATPSPHPMRGEGKVRGAVGHSTSGFIGNWYSLAAVWTRRQRKFSKTLLSGCGALIFSTSSPTAESRVVIISPHNEAIRYEFGRGFDRWHRRRFGGGVAVEWRDVGGTADALRFVQSEFAAKPEGIGIDIFFGGGSEPFAMPLAEALSEFVANGLVVRRDEDDSRLRSERRSDQSQRKNGPHEESEGLSLAR